MATFAAIPLAENSKKSYPASGPYGVLLIASKCMNQLVESVFEAVPV